MVAAGRQHADNGHLARALQLRPVRAVKAATTGGPGSQLEKPPDIISQALTRGPVELPFAAKAFYIGAFEGKPPRKLIQLHAPVLAFPFECTRLPLPQAAKSTSRR